eukprot:gnl/TRDRNA2_/TRDRNA2_34448_c0_seq1.p1 gnl/TRDRNA2_/TRDRNA2_34448_c0~~gnl/TRDRNA2_/TRDRNA2_34448_c0_seq1.p1  ORF type:complete len:247 (-),score=32.23 gnl/TRDRNA2_/TRDRNA2_34448_c0_seq1:33-773(-)
MAATPFHVVELLDAVEAGLLTAWLLPPLRPRELTRLSQAAPAIAERIRVPGALSPWVTAWQRWRGQRCSIQERAEAGDIEGVWGCIREAEDSGDSNASLQIINASDDYGMTAMHYASVYGDPKLLRLLVEAHADVQARYFAVNVRNGCYPLHLAAHRGNTHCVKALLLAQCDVNAVDAAMRTALHYARTAGRWQVERLLLDFGALPESDIFQDDARICEAALADDGSPRSCRASWTARVAAKHGKA